MKTTMTYHPDDIAAACEQIGLDPARFINRCDDARIRRQFDPDLEAAMRRGIAEADAAREAADRARGEAWKRLEGRRFK